MTSVDEARTGTKEATAITAAANAAVLGALPFDDTTDFDDVRRGLIEAAAPAPVTRSDGVPMPAWNMGAYAFEDADEAPPTVNPSLWRQARLNRVAGLFEVTERIYQLRGMDISNMTIVEGDTGIIVIDPMISTETAKTGLDLYRKHRGDKPVVAVIYTHSHVDHYGGVRAIISDEDVTSGRVKIYAPEGFLYHAVSENVFAGTAMSRRSHFQYGVFLPRDERGQVDLGLGKAVSNGTITLIPPTDLITENGSRTIDGVRMEFQLTPGTEAPSEMNFYFPQMRALCAAENACHTLHNILTLRGAEVRDTRQWSRYLDEAIEMFADRSDVVFASHHWPTWGSERVAEFLADQRDMYQYLHDQTLRLINHGLTPMEIAETLTKLPPDLEKRWYLRGYYGSISHGVRAIYQRYLGFYDGNPAHLNPHQPVEAAKRYVKVIGGPDKVLAAGREAFDSGDYRWAAELVNHLVFADPGNSEAVALQADALEQLGYQCENGTWRSLYLMGAHELRNGVFHGVALTTTSPDMIRSMSPDLYFDYLGIRLNGDKAAHVPETRMAWTFTDLDETYVVTLRNATLTYRVGKPDAPADVSLTLTKAALDAISLSQSTFDKAIADGAITVEGDKQRLVQLLSMLDDFDVMFNVVTP
ncbi:MAG: MBL fold metallo-hydrolase [Hamadaea sp.]|uniref:alkyl/aryl-sulfatase n=1 Tax=Hamadaea sp. TaxID=2024425 RepID=UPI0017FEF3AF|nr:alkyl sulfatase dimerization domain-containing protein [Hamadaea sp.]NUT20951.1 MBL fold metallo-hydrolase [Hamadaea sp.]